MARPMMSPATRGTTQRTQDLGRESRIGAAAGDAGVRSCMLPPSDVMEGVEIGVLARRSLSVPRSPPERASRKRTGTPRTTSRAPRGPSRNTYPTGKQLLSDGGGAQPSQSFEVADDGGVVRRRRHHRRARSGFH